MAITKERKDELVAQYIDLIEQSDAIFLAEYKGMTVKQVEELRKKLRESNGSFHVTKNTLLKVALQQTGRAVPDDLLHGQIAAGFALSEAPTVAKTLLEYAKTQEKLIVRGGVVNQSVLSADQVDAFSKLPGLDQLRAQLVGMLQTPSRGIVSAVANGVRQVVNVLDAYAKKDENAAAAEAAA